VADRYELTPLFDAFLPKPDLYIDDMPSTIFNSPLLNRHDHPTWQSLADHIAKTWVATP
jgi:hypothetical protein